jgi:hypothetical protein
MGIFQALCHHDKPDSLPWCMTRLAVLGNPTVIQIQSTRWLSGIPRPAIMFKILQPTLASTLCPCKVRLRIVRPMSAL